MKLIKKIYEILNLCKDFEVGYTSLIKNCMIIDYNGRRYVVNFTEILNPSESIFDDLNKLEQYTNKTQ